MLYEYSMLQVIKQILSITDLEQGYIGYPKPLLSSTHYKQPFY